MDDAQKETGGQSEKEDGGTGEGDENALSRKEATGNNDVDEVAVLRMRRMRTLLMSKRHGISLK